MNVERTIEFILEAQAKSEVRMAAHERRMDALDRRMNGVTKLIQQGTRLLVSFQKETDRKIDALIDGQLRADARFEEAQRRTDAALKGLAEAQKITEQKLQRLIDRQSRNGH